LTSNTEEAQRQISSLRDSMDSLTKSINSNMFQILQRLATIEREMELRSEYVNKSLSDHGTGLSELGKAYEQAKGVSWTMKVGFGLLGALEAWHIVGNWIYGVKK
jgi:hypothetical protein